MPVKCQLYFKIQLRRQFRSNLLDTDIAVYGPYFFLQRDWLEAVFKGTAQIRGKIENQFLDVSVFFSPAME